MKLIFLSIALTTLTGVGYAKDLHPAVPARSLGITESDKSITKTFVDSTGTSEVLTVFTDPQTSLSWQIENKDSKGHLSSKLKKFRDGSETIENFGKNGKIVSKIQTDSKGHSKIENF